MRWACAILIVWLGAGWLGCRSESPDKSRVEHGATFRVAVVGPQTCDDAAWTEAACNGMAAIDREFHAITTIVENVAPKDSYAVFLRLADAGNDLVLAHGSEYADSVERAARDRPRTSFGILAQYPGNNRNLAGIHIREYELSYLAAAAAALASEHHKIAILVGAAYGSMEAHDDYARRGAHAIAPETEVMIRYLDTWTDKAKVRRVANDVIDQGADVLVVNADIAGLAAFEVAARRGAEVVGWVLDQESIAPDTVLTSALQRYEVLYVEAARIANRGHWEGKQYSFGVSDGAQALAPFRGALSPDKLAVIHSLEAEVLADKLEVEP